MSGVTEKFHLPDFDFLSNFLSLTCFFLEAAPTSSTPSIVEIGTPLVLSNRPPHSCLVSFFIFDTEREGVCLFYQYIQTSPDYQCTGTP